LQGEAGEEASAAERPEISPATAKPWIKRKTTSMIGASTPTWL
jgi:hypothetical protein